MDKPYIILVDDDKDVLNVLSENVRLRFGKNFRVEEFDNPYDALNFLDSRLEKIIVAMTIADMRMPGMNGVEYLTKFKEKFPESKTVVVSAYSDTEYLIQSMNLGVNRYLLKPITNVKENFYPILDSLLNEFIEQYALDDPALLLFKKQNLEKPEGLKVIMAVSQEDKEKCFKIRYDVLVNEYKYMPPNPTGLEVDGFDVDAVHFLTTIEKIPVGTIRIIKKKNGVMLPMEELFNLERFKDTNLAEISRFMVLHNYRKTAVGFSLMKVCWIYAIKSNITDYVISANPGTEKIVFSEDEKPSLLRMYEKIGFKAFDAPKIYEKVHMPAVPMHLKVKDVVLGYKKLFAIPDPNIIV